MKEGSIHIGTSGWSYKHWKKIFYPEDLPATDWLKFYANFFLTTEINTSFYHTPQPSAVEGWKKKVPPDFMFCPKMSRYLTHMKKLNEPEESMERFFTAFLSLKERQGPFLYSYPGLLLLKKIRLNIFIHCVKRNILIIILQWK